MPRQPLKKLAEPSTELSLLPFREGEWNGGELWILEPLEMPYTDRVEHLAKGTLLGLQMQTREDLGNQKQKLPLSLHAGEFIPKTVPE